jgi:hypothetical protein
MGDAAKILTEIVSKEGDAEALKLKAPQDNTAAEVEKSMIERLRKKFQRV